MKSSVHCDYENIMCYLLLILVVFYSYIDIIIINLIWTQHSDDQYTIPIIVYDRCKFSFKLSYSTSSSIIFINSATIQNNHSFLIQFTPSFLIYSSLTSCNCLIPWICILPTLFRPFTLSNLSHHKKEQRNTYKYNCDLFDVSVSLIHPTHFPHSQHKIPTFLYISSFSQPFRTFPWLFFSFSKPPYPIISFLQFHWLMFFICLFLSLLFLFFMNRLIFHCYFSLFLLPFSPLSS